jgi:ABC-type lipoprotein release transport system permease subunit
MNDNELRMFILGMIVGVLGVVLGAFLGLLIVVMV